VPPDATHLSMFLSRVRRRLVLLRVLEGATAGLIAALVGSIVLAQPATGTIVVMTLVAAALGVAGRVAFGEGFEPGWWRQPTAIADRVERRVPACRNMLFTATELLFDPAMATADIASRVRSEAIRVISVIDPGALFPAVSRALGLAAVAAVLMAVTAWGPLGGGHSPAMASLDPGRPIAIDVVELTIAPPDYLAQPARTERDPGHIEVPEGSRLGVRVRGNATGFAMETVSGKRPFDGDVAGWASEMVVTGDDYIAIEALDATGQAGARRLIAITVVPDGPPRVTITEPGRDLFFSTAPDSLRVHIEASDDHGLAALRMRFTTVSGSGEQFSFEEQELPVTVARTDPRHWSATVSWPLLRLRLTPGDMVVYRAEAEDRRPGGRAAPSESYVLEVVSTSAVAAEGFAVDDERDRYAVSQQMVILKTERLIAGRGAMPEDSVRQRAREIAAEQRQVRAEFVFMLGGEVEDASEELAGTQMVDETAEAEAEGDLLAGRMQNRGRIEMQRAMRAMSRAASHLVESRLDSALVQERAALENLMRAFSRARFLLRALTQREALDLSRRLSGSLADALTERVPGIEPAPEPRSVALRRILAGIAALSAQEPLPPDAATRATASAVDLMRIDPGDDSLRTIAGRIEAIASDLGRGGPGDATARLQQVVLDLAARLRAGVPDAPAARDLESDVLRGALVDALRRRGVGR